MNIAQLDGAEDSDDSDGSAERVGTGTDDTEKCFFKDYEEWEIQDIIDNKHSFLCCECGVKGCTNVCLKCVQYFQLPGVQKSTYVLRHNPNSPLLVWTLLIYPHVAIAA